MNSLSVCLIRVFGAPPQPLLAHSSWTRESKHNFVTSLLNFLKNVKMFAKLDLGRRDELWCLFKLFRLQGS